MNSRKYVNLTFIIIVNVIFLFTINTWTVVAIQNYFTIPFNFITVINVPLFNVYDVCRRDAEMNSIIRVAKQLHLM